MTQKTWSDIAIEPDFDFQQISVRLNFSLSIKETKMLNVGEQLVSSYLRYIRKCDFVETNVHTGKSQGEIDVIGLSLSKQQVYICEVTIHIDGLQYVNSKNNQTDNVQKLTDKFSRGIEYAQKYYDEYDQHFMFWSPIVKDSKGKPENNQMRHLEEIQANIKDRYKIDVECIVNEKFQECLVEMRNYAKTSKENFQCPLMRLMQIEEYLDKHVKKITLMKVHESTPILTDESNEEQVDGSVPAIDTAPATEFPYTGPQIKALRENAGLTQVAVAVKLGMKRSSSAAISDWEAERVKVPAKHQTKLLSLYESMNT